MQEKQESNKPKLKRCAISVSGKTYDRLRSSVEESESIQRFVDGIITSALDDPTILDRIATKCRSDQRWP